MGQQKAEHPEVDVLLADVEQRLAKIRGQSPDEIRRDARRRVLRFEADSMRRQ